MSTHRGRPYVPILHGALDTSRPDERDTVVQAEEIAETLVAIGCRTSIVGCGLDLAVVEKVASGRPAAVFNLVETLGGEGRLGPFVPALLAARGVRFTGAGASALLATTDKLFTKRLLRAAGLPTPDFWQAGNVTEAPGRVIVKSVWEDASFGIDRDSVVDGRRAKSLIAAKAKKLGGDWFAEAFVEGREFNVSVLSGPNGPEVLPLAEIEFRGYPADRPRIVDFEAKWVPESHAFHNTPRRFLKPGEDEDLSRQLKELALACWRLFGIEGYARIDFRIDGQGRPFIIEANANPCLSRDAGLFAAAERGGFTHETLIRRILSAAGLADIRLAKPLKLPRLREAAPALQLAR
jgi:D-alanine-D-alanine ligase